MSTIVALASALVVALALASCTLPVEGGVDFGISVEDHDRLYFPAGEREDSALTVKGACDGEPCAALTGSHQCSSADVANAFSRPFCQPDDRFQGRLEKQQGAYSCEQCHGGSGSMRVARCAECHLALPIVPPGDPRDLDGAKSPDERHRHAAGFAVDTPTCASCHAENFDTNRDNAFDRNDLSAANPDRVDGHLPFSIALGAAHYRVSCADCNGAARADKPWALDFQRFTCATCHAANDVDAIHTEDGVPRIDGYVGPDEATCLDCHADGRTP